MSKFKKILIAMFTIFIVAGFLIGIMIPKNYPTGCTKKMCYCANFAEAIQCNACSAIDPIFITGIVNIFKSYSGVEIIICKDNKDIGSRIDIDKSKGRVNANILFIPVYPFDSFNKFLKDIIRDFRNSSIPPVKVPQSTLLKD